MLAALRHRPLAARLLRAIGLGPRASRPPAPDPVDLGTAEAHTAPASLPPGAAEALLQRLEWTVIRRLDGLRQGDVRSLLRGAGLDLADLREYQPHDDVRHIDWNVTARTDAPHVRLFQEDRDMTVTFLLDLSASMDWGSVLQPQAADRLRTKQQVATELVAVLARLFTRSGHRIGALIERQGLERELPARGGRGQVLQLLHRIGQPAAGGRGMGSAATGVTVPTSAAPDLPAMPWWRRRPARATAPVAESTRLATLLTAAEARLRRRGTVIVVSDFLSQPGWEAPLGRLAQRHDLVCVRLSDPAERALPALGLVLLQDAESGEALLVDTDDPALRARHAALAAAQEATLRASLARTGADTLELDTAEPLPATLRRFLALRGLGGRRPVPPRPANPLHPKAAP